MLVGEQLPHSAFGIFLASRVADFTPMPGGSLGNLCLGGAIGRFVAPGEVQSIQGGAPFLLRIDLDAIPTPTAFVAVQPGQTWNFQAWYMDVVGATNNFTDAVSVTFQ